jgi:hypothetical protein
MLDADPVYGWDANSTKHTCGRSSGTENSPNAFAYPSTSLSMEIMEGADLKLPDSAWTLGGYVPTLSVVNCLDGRPGHGSRLIIIL